MKNKHALKMLNAFESLLVRSHGFDEMTIDAEYRVPIAEDDRDVISHRRDFCRNRAGAIDAQFKGTVVEEKGGSSGAMAWRMLAEILDLALIDG